MRLHDRIMAGGVMSPWPRGVEPVEGYAQRMATHSTRVVREAQIIACDEVTRFYYEESDKDRWSLKDDFPNLAPPHPIMFLQTKAPRFIRSHDYGDVAWEDEITEWGILLMAIDPDKARSIGLDADGVLDVAGSKWVYEGVLFIVMNDKLRGPCAQMAFAIAEDGSYVPTSHGGILLQSVLHNTDKPEFDSGIASSMFEMVKPLLLSICFMHCKNVVRVPVEPKLTRQQRRRANAGADVPAPGTRYTTLAIDPMKQVLRREGGSEHVGTRKAMHICRGHFKTYTPDKPLFGRPIDRSVMVWVPQHLKGTDHTRRVEKTYDVKPKKEA